MRTLDNFLFLCIYYSGDIMIVSYNSKELDLLARIMRAEALNEGELGMLMVGNVAFEKLSPDGFFLIHP